MPAAYKELNEIQQHLEDYFKDMQDLEFTIQNGKLWMLQTRNGKRTGAAMVRIAMEMLRQGVIDAPTAVLRVEPEKLDELLHPVFDKNAIKKANIIAKGLPASPGAATGQIVFFADEAEKMGRRGQADDPRPHRNLARRPQGHELGQRYPDRARRHDLARSRRSRGMGKCAYRVQASCRSTTRRVRSR